MAGKSSSFSSTLILCAICILVGWFWGVRSTKNKVEAALHESKESIELSQEVPSPTANEEVSLDHSTNKANLDLDLSKTETELMQHANTIADSGKRQLYLRKLLEHWVLADENYSPEIRDKFLAGVVPMSQIKNAGYETLFSFYAAKLSDPILRDAWKENFANHPARSEIYSQFLARDLLSMDPKSLLQNSSHWNTWEKERYQQKVLEGWTRNEPSQAYAWYEANKSLYSEGTKNLIFDAWAQADFGGLAAHLDTILDEGTRRRALDSMAKIMARRGTDGALDWANSLSNVEDQDLAHDTIYRETPRGIGAVLKPENGFPSVVKPLVDNGLEVGDLIISAQNGDEATEFYGKDLMEAVEALVGTPGTDVTVQIMRLDPTTGKYQQTEITIIRQQLWMEGEKDQEP